MTSIISTDKRITCSLNYSRNHSSASGFVTLCLFVILGTSAVLKSSHHFASRLIHRIHESPEEELLILENESTRRGVSLEFAHVDITDFKDLPRASRRLAQDDRRRCRGQANH
jgi:hypothetical protein